MKDTTQLDRPVIYEVGYLIGNTIPEEKVLGEVDKIKDIINKSNSVVIAEENPVLEKLAYTIKVKSSAGTYIKYDEAYFGWVKFEVDSSAIDSIKKSIEIIPSVIRSLIIKTVRENTYLGKRVNEIAKSIPNVIATDDKKPTTTASVEEMDKSIDDMVKEV
jgi:ribosomal protein S6